MLINTRRGETTEDTILPQIFCNYVSKKSQLSYDFYFRTKQIHTTTAANKEKKYVCRQVFFHQKLQSKNQRMRKIEEMHYSLHYFNQVISKYRERFYLQWKGFHTLKGPHVKYRNLNATENPYPTLTINRNFVKRVYVQSYKMNTELLKQGFITDNIFLRQNNVILRTINFYKKIMYVQMSGVRCFQTSLKHEDLIFWYPVPQGHTETCGYRVEAILKTSHKAHLFNASIKMVGL